MPYRIRKLILLFLLTWLPLQSMASPAVAVLCDGAARAAGAAPHAHFHVGHEHGHGHDGNDSGPGVLDHSCCDHYSSGIVATVLAVNPVLKPVLEVAFPRFLQLLFFAPPQRPPLT